MKLKKESIKQTNQKQDVAKYQNYKTELSRRFLLADLPEPLTRASEHLQLFDNYIKNTRIRLRAIRSPQTKEWTRSLQQRFPANGNSQQIQLFSEIFLNGDEYAAFEKFEGREIRKNRYFYEENGNNFEIDVYMGNLWGLCIAKTFFETEGKLDNFKMPAFAVAEITDNIFFMGENLVEKNFADVQEEFQQIKMR